MRSGLTFVALLLSVLACADEPPKRAEPTGPPAANTGSAPAPPSMRGATVCLAYGRDRELVRARLKDAPKDEKLQNEFKELESLILDAC